LRDPYEVLGVARTASSAELQKVYRKLAKTLHPDLNRETNRSRTSSRRLRQPTTCSAIPKSEPALTRFALPHNGLRFSVHTGKILAGAIAIRVDDYHLESEVEDASGVHEVYPLLRDATSPRSSPRPTKRSIDRCR
jgi:hypothetical protein